MEFTPIFETRWSFAAIPGAIPGALPVVIGYAANDSNLFARDSVYLFFVLFLWQMPHFWVLAMKFRDDYERAGIPTLPGLVGSHKTLFHIGLWTHLYLILVFGTPWFVHAS